VREKPCRWCGAKIVFASNAEGRAKLPLQRVRSVYSLDAASETARALELPERQLAVSHWETCPKAQRAKAEQQRRLQAQQAAAERQRREASGA
jgi:hypothetical protein